MTILAYQLFSDRINIEFFKQRLQGKSFIYPSNMLS